MNGTQTKEIKQLPKHPVGKRVRAIIDALNEIGCYVHGRSPLRICHENFHSRVVEKPKIERTLTPREEVIKNYYKDCADSGIPAFAMGGKCFSCGYDLVDVENQQMKGTTGCPKCHRSFCD